jgi:hypothetical protein
MPRVKETKAECYVKYEELRQYYEQQYSNAHFMVESWKISIDVHKRNHMVWHWSGREARWKRLLDRWEENRHKSCDRRP